MLLLLVSLSRVAVEDVILILEDLGHCPPKSSFQPRRPAEAEKKLCWEPPTLTVLVLVVNDAMRSPSVALLQTLTFCTLVCHHLVPAWPLL